MEFMGLTLDGEALHTPEGSMSLSEITRAEFVRDVVRDGEHPGTQQTSAPAVAGGAVVGGALLGGVGAVAGGLLGSTVKEDVPGRPRLKTQSVKLVFETGAAEYSLDIPRDKEMGAIDFAKTVAHAVKKA